MSRHEHAHDHGHGHPHGHAHAHPDAGAAARNADDGGDARRALAWALGLTAAYALIECVGGWLANSLALISDAGHMGADAAALLIALLAARLAARPAGGRHSYGYARAEVIGAFVNGLTMLAIVVWIAVEAVSRVFRPLPVHGTAVMLIAAAGLLVNLGVLWLLARRGGHAGHAHADLNTRAAAVHVMGDLLGSVAAIAAGAVVQFTGWTLADPLLSVLVALLILRTTWRLLAESLDVLMESVPPGIDFAEVGKALAALDGVVSVHDLHVWRMDAERRALSAHLLLREERAWPRVLKAARDLLATRFGVDHVTLQPEWLAAPPAGRVLPLAVRNAKEDS